METEGLCIVVVIMTIITEVVAVFHKDDNFGEIFTSQFMNKLPYYILRVQ